jgi:uncharacterized protein (TIGR03435 family)
MSKHIEFKLTLARRVAVVTATVGTLAAPVMVGIINALAVQAQSPPAAARSASAPTPRFEVASVKPCKVEDNTGGGGKSGGGGRIRWNPGRLNEECQTVFNLIRDAYLAYPDGQPWRTAALGDTALNDPGQVACTGCGDGLPPVSSRQFGQPIKGSPAWLNADRFTIDAKAEGPESMAMMRGPMMQSLLEERFKLKIHRENREVPVYELTLAQGGPKLQTARAGSCISLDRWQPASLPSREHPTPASAVGCGLPSPSPSGLDFNGTTIASLCRQLLSGWSDRDVIDKTGLAGMFDFHFDIDSMEPPDDATPEPGAPGLPRHANNNAAMFAAVVRELPKLGLKLMPAKGVGEYLVIDHVERPSGN